MLDNNHDKYNNYKKFIYIAMDIKKEIYNELANIEILFGKNEEYYNLIEELKKYIKLEQQEYKNLDESFINDFIKDKLRIIFLTSYLLIKQEKNYNKKTFIIAEDSAEDAISIYNRILSKLHQNMSGNNELNYLNNEFVKRRELFIDQLIFENKYKAQIDLLIKEKHDLIFENNNCEMMYIYNFYDEEYHLEEKTKSYYDFFFASSLMGIANILNVAQNKINKDLKSKDLIKQIEFRVAYSFLDPVRKDRLQRDYLKLLSESNNNYLEKDKALVEEVFQGEKETYEILNKAKQRKKK